MKMEKPSESKVLSVRLLSGLSTKQPEIKKVTEMEAEAEHRREEGNQQSEINLARGKQPDCQAHRLDRSRSAQEINKHVSDSIKRSERLQQIRS